MRKYENIKGNMLMALILLVLYGLWEFIKWLM